MGIFIKHYDKYIPIDTQSIITVESMGKELIVCLEKEKLILKKTLVSFLEADINNLLQVNRSTLLNVNKIIKVTTSSYPIVELACGDETISVKVSRNYRKQFMDTLKSKNTII